jgi:hypothetical protein
MNLTGQNRENRAMNYLAETVRANLSQEHMEKTAVRWSQEEV